MILADFEVERPKLLNPSSVELSYILGLAAFTDISELEEGREAAHRMAVRLIVYFGMSLGAQCSVRQSSRNA